MPDQVDYYNQFGELYREDILNCPEPQLWTTDYQEKGRIYEEMLQRINEQTALAEQFFTDELPILDVGCGFGRQAIVLAKKGFSVVGFDTSKTFIKIAEELFRKHNLTGTFLNSRIEDLPPDQFSQILLFDVIEHIKPSARKTFLTRIHSLSLPNATLIISLPHLKSRLTSRVNNSIRKRITQHFYYFMAREEHPYPIPTAQTMRKLTGLFTIIKFKETPATDYYVLRKV